MQKITQIAAALAIGASISFSAFAADKTFVKVNGASISQNIADAFIAEQKAKGAPDSPELRNAVREELIRRGIGPAQLEVKGYGTDRPLVAHGDPDARVKNRRVQFTVAK